MNRSPAAELIWRKEIGGEVDSAGFKAENRPITKKMRTVLIDLGIEKELVEKHRSKNITKKLLEKSTIIFCMTPHYSTRLYSEFGQRKKVRVLPLFIGKTRIADPMFSSDINTYIACAEDIKNSILFIKNNIMKLKSGKLKIDIREWL